MLRNNDEKLDILYVAKTIFIGVSMSVVVSVVCAALTAWLIGKGSIAKEVSTIAAVAIVFVSSFAGCFGASAIMKEKFLLCCGLCLLVYMIILAGANVIFFDGRFTGAFGNLIGGVCGAALGFLLTTKLGAKDSGRRFRVK